jgi:hypothetical protein
VGGHGLAGDDVRIEHHGFTLLDSLGAVKVESSPKTYRLAADGVVAIQMPANTATRPMIRCTVIGSPTRDAASRLAAIG